MVVVVLGDEAEFAVGVVGALAGQIAAQPLVDEMAEVLVIVWEVREVAAPEYVGLGNGDESAVVAAIEGLLGPEAA